MSTRIGARELKGLLRVLKDADVASFTAGDLTVTFRDLGPQVPVAFQEVDAGPPGDGPLDLPEGVYDPRAALLEVYRRKAERS